MPSRNSAADVTLTVLNYNGRDLLPLIMPSIFRQTVQGFRVHLLDDASSDDSTAYVTKHWPQVDVLPSERNMGVSATMARGVASAQTTYVALLNNDLELDPCWLQEMLAELEAYPEAASADGKMLNFHDRRRLDGAGDLMARNGYPRRRGQLELDRGQYDSPGEVFSATGGAALFRRAAFDLVGSFDTDLGAYYEDVDWGFRARLLGLTTRYVPQAVSYHLGSATTGRDQGRYAQMIVRNQMVVVLKNFPGWLLLRNLPRILLFELKWLAFDVLHGLGRAHMRGALAAARLLPATLRKRRRIQRSRTASLRHLQRAFS
jgi:GT2 family glycosyltransferase